MLTFSPFKLDHYRQMLLHLLGRGDVEFITYADLEWQDEDSHLADYPQEWVAWRQSLALGRRNPHAVYILLQHDIDSGPQQTIDMLRLEAEYGLRSTTMVFNRWRGDGADQPLTEYPADFAAMAALERQGFLFGYHCNAFHNNAFVEDGIYDLFMEDVAALRQNLSIRFFSPHGGQTVDGRGNASFDYISATGVDVKHVHNGHSPRFNSTYTDGGLIKRLRDGAPSLDFFAWSENLKPGGRYRILIHPQYFSDELFQVLPLEMESWYSRLVAA